MPEPTRPNLDAIIARLSGPQRTFAVSPLHPARIDKTQLWEVAQYARHLETVLQQIADLPSVRQDEATVIADTALAAVPGTERNPT